jgi:hypothetical protein
VYKREVRIGSILHTNLHSSPSDFGSRHNPQTNTNRRPPSPYLTSANSHKRRMQKMEPLTVLLLAVALTADIGSYLSFIVIVERLWKEI